MKKIFIILYLVAILGYFQGFAYASSDVKEKLKAMKPKDYPTQAIEFVVVYPAGGGMDVTARILAKYVEKYIDSRVIVVNKTGGAGLIGHTYLATQAVNDGHIVGILSTSWWTDALTRTKGKWSYKDVEPVAYINEDPTTWIVTTTGPLKDKSIKDVIDMVKKNPESFKIAIVPEMSFQFLLESVEAASGAKFLQVPFQGGLPGITALVGGHIDIATGFLGEYRGHLEARKVKVIAASGPERSVYFPDVPTFNEVLGVNNIMWLAWRFAGVPKGTPKERINFLEAAINAALHDPECIQEFDKMGVKVGIKFMNAKQTSDMMEKFVNIDKEFFIKTKRISQ